MPGATPSMSTRGLVKRYRPTSTMPIMSNKIIGSSSHSHSNHPTPHLDLNYSFSNMNQTPAPYAGAGVGGMSSPKPYAPPRPIPPATTAYPAPPPIPPASSFNAPVAAPMSPSTTSNFSNYDHPWKDSLRSTNFNYSSGMPGYRPAAQPQANKAYSHHEAADFSVKSPGGPKAINIQYNSPIGLYSKDNINEELHKKFGFATISNI
jgi:hypothetical protein